MKVCVQAKAFGAQAILGQIELTMDAGEVHVICGPSGIGKTTLLRLIAGLDDGFEGSVQPRPDRIGYVFQEPRLLPWLNVYENVALVCEGRDVDIDSLLVDVGLEKDRSILAANLSLGMARRVALARALIIEPEILVLDEPFVSLDPELARKLRQLTFKLVRKYGLKALLVTHDPIEAFEVGDFVHVLNGAPAQLRSTLKVDLDDEKRFCSASVQAYFEAHKSVFAFS